MPDILCEKALDVSTKRYYKASIPYWINVPGMDKDACEKYHVLIRARLLEAKGRRELHLVAKSTGIIATRLSEFIQNTRLINEKYLIQFVRGGFVKVPDLIATWKGNETPEEREFVLALKVFEDPRFLKALAQIESAGLTETALQILETLASKK